MVVWAANYSFHFELFYPPFLSTLVLNYIVSYFHRSPYFNREWVLMSRGRIGREVHFNKFNNHTKVSWLWILNSSGLYSVFLPPSNTHTPHVLFRVSLKFNIAKMKNPRTWIFHNFCNILKVIWVAIGVNVVRWGDSLSIVWLTSLSGGVGKFNIIKMWVKLWY